MINLLQGWEWKSLGEIFNIERGGSPRPIKEFLTDKEDGINWIKIGDIKNQKYLYKTEEKIIQEGLKKSKLVIEGDLLVSNSMSFGKPVIVKLQKGAIHDGWLLLKEKINLNKEYFYYLFSSNFMYNFLSYQASGSTVKNLNIDKLKQIEIPLPPLKEQERIVGILDESFSKIDESIKILEQDLLNLDELMQSALQKAFNPLKDNAKENYKLPQGWEWKSLEEISEINPRNKIDDNINVSFISMDKILDGYNNDFSYKVKKWKEVKKGFTHFKQGDIGVAKITPCFENRKSVIFDKLENGFGAGTTELHIIRANESVYSKFLLWFFKTEWFIQNGILNMTGATGHKRISKDFIKSLKIPLPPLKEQEQIASHLDELSSHVKNLKQNYQAQIKDLQELKKSLLDKAFKGNL
ncbi:TPA: restriction endonuclease subunit S [Campylobacter coli]|nr:restriction endonuclease subunit S [Campylobacter coli]HEH4989792.1 restriction endonuclease subunit S [Campylobacter coli]HEH5122746.1 restriction endonuclease subunit S [Campylobacter coli]HEH5452878.1 restriction endonuclease subunit S [Campylobacter coli]